MYTKLSKSELRIIEQTKREGEALYTEQNGKNENGSVKKTKPGVKPYIFMAVIFIGMALLATIVISLLN